MLSLSRSERSEQTRISRINTKKKNMNGTVKKWDDERGFGFIKVPGEREGIFVHRTAILDDGRNGIGKGKRLESGDQVEFETAPSRREGLGPQAINVRVV